MSPSVNVPVNTKKRDADIENKLHLYGIWNAFSNGKLPSNNQIDVALNSFVNHKKLKTPNEKLSSEGKVILEDFRHVVEEAKRLLLVKNGDQALQEFIWNATQLNQKGGLQTGVPGAPVDKDTASRDAQQGLEGLKTLGQLIITNGQFRKLLNDATTLLREIAGDAATKSASKVNPPEDQLRRIDDPAPDHTWHDAPDFSRGNIKSQFQNKTGVDSNQARDHARDVAGNATQFADPYGSRDPNDTANRAAENQRNGTSNGVDLQQGLRTGVNDLSQRAHENIPEEHKDRAREYRERTNHYLRSKMPQERCDRVIWRLKKMIVEIQSHQDYSQAIDTLLRLAETYGGHGKALAGQGTGTVKGAHQTTHLKTAEHQLKVLIERFANNTSTDDFFEALNDIYRDADQDPELKNWFRSLDSFIRKCLQKEGYVLEDDSEREYNQLYDHGRFLLRDRYRDHTDRLVNEVKFIGDQFSADPSNQHFADALQKLFFDLGNDESGNVAFKKHLVKDISEVILPDIFESIRYVPIPRIEYNDPAFDAVVENLVVESDNLMPNVFEIGNDSYFRFGRKAVGNKKKQQIMVSASGIQCDLRDVSYYVKRKQGFPAITDIGVVDIFLGGDGLSFKLELATPEKKDRAHFFKVNKIKVDVKHMNIKLKQSKHKMLFGIFKPLLMKVVKPVIVKAFEKQIRDTFSKLDAFAYRVYQEEQKIETDFQNNPDPENAANIYNRYYNAIQTELLNRKRRLEDKVVDKKVNVAVTKQDSHFKDISLPGGISTRATEYKEKATKGDSWESEVFGIGKAAPTSDLPKPVPVTRKSPYANRRSVRGREHGSTSRDSGYQHNQHDEENKPYGYTDQTKTTGNSNGFATNKPEQQPQSQSPGRFVPSVGY